MAVTSRKRSGLRSPLQPVLQSAESWQNAAARPVRGTIRVTFHPVQLAAQAEEIITGSISSQFGGLTQDVRGIAQAPDTIITNFRPMFQHATAAMESFGTVGTRFSSQTLQLNATGWVSAQGGIAQRFYAIETQRFYAPDGGMAQGIVAGVGGSISTVMRSGVKLDAQGATDVTGTISQRFFALNVFPGYDHQAEGTFTPRADNTIIQEFPMRISLHAEGYTNVIGDIDTTMPKMVQSASGWTNVTGTISQSLPQFFQGARGGTVNDGPIEQTFQGMHMHASGEVINDGAAQTIFTGHMTQEAVGWAEIIGHISTTFYPMVDAGNLTEVIRGDIAITMPRMTQAAAGWKDIKGTISTLHGQFKQSASGSAVLSGSIAQTFFGVSQSLAGTITNPEDMIPQGRLTLTTAVPFLATDVTAAGTVYYTPATGVLIPLYSGSAYVFTTFAEISQALSDTTHSPAASVANANYDLFVWLNSGVVTLSRGPLWRKASTVTMTIASPGVITWNGHGLANGTPVSLATSGTLPTGLVAGTTYFVVATATNTFELAATVGGAAINTTGSQSGTHTATAGNDTARGTGAGTTDLDFVSGLYLNKQNITNGPAADRGTYVGTIRTNASNQVDQMMAPSGASGGSSNHVFVWNMYNRRTISSKNTDSATTWTQTTVDTWRAKDNNINNSTQFIVGLSEEAIYASASMKGFHNNGNGASIGFGLDSTTTALNGSECFFGNTANIWCGGGSSISLMPGLGFHYVCPLETNVANTQTWYGSSTGTGTHVMSTQAWELELSC